AADSLHSRCTIPETRVAACRSLFRCGDESWLRLTVWPGGPSRGPAGSLLAVLALAPDRVRLDLGHVFLLAASIGVGVAVLLFLFLLVLLLRGIGGGSRLESGLESTTGG